MIKYSKTHNSLYERYRLIAKAQQQLHCFVQSSALNTKYVKRPI
jgi:hypothetical protein